MNTTAKIAVAGATGRVGRHIVSVLAERGQEVVPISRGSGVDVITGEGLNEALVGVETVIDAATTPSPDEVEATAFFTTATRNLQDAGVQAGVERIIVVSIVGADRFGGGYGAAKIVHEQAMLSGPIPASVLRATQFHEFVAQLVDWGRNGEASYVPKMRTQLVAARAVAEELADLAVDPPPAGEITEIAGPREENLSEMAKLLVARHGDAVRIEEVSDPDDPLREAFENGWLLPGPNARLAGPTFEEWLAST